MLQLFIMIICNLFQGGYMESKNQSSWGGKRQGAGRKKSENSKKTMVVRVDENLLHIIKIIKEKYKSGCEIDNLFNVTKNQELLQVQLKEQSDRNLEVVLQIDKEHLQSVKLKSEVMSLKSTVRSHNKELEALKHKIYDCQALKKDGNRCTRPAKVKTIWQGVEINTCIQHSDH